MSPSQNQVPSKELLISGHQLHPPPQVQAHAHGSSKPSVTGVFSVCFPRQLNTTDLPWPRMTCCDGRHIWPNACSSSDFFSIFFPESMIKHIKTETNRYAKSIADKLRRTKKLKPHSIWHTWTGVRLHEMYLFFAVIIHMCLAKKPKTQRLLVNK